MSGAIWAAYNAVGALEVPCPTCSAPVSIWCTREDGKVRRLPCIARAAAAGGPEARATSTAGAGQQVQAVAPVDFSEPRHQPH